MNLDSFFEAYLNSFYFDDIPIDREKVLKQASIEWDELYGVSQEEYIKRAYARYGIAGTTPNDYLERIIALDEKRSVLVGIRHINGDKNRPFLSIWPNFSLLSIETVRKIVKETINFYRVFSPQYVQVWTNPKSSFKKYLDINARPRRGMYLGEISKIAKLKELNNFASGYRVTKFDSIDYYEWYIQACYKFHNNNPLLKDLTPLNSKEDLDEAKRNEMLWCLKYEEEPIGLLQLDEELIFGEKSIYVSDIIISEKFRGKGLGSKFQIDIIQKLQRKYRLIYGEIDMNNIASLKSAKKMGRILSRCEYLIPIKSL